MTLRVTGSEAVLDATSVIVPQWGAVLRITSSAGLLLEVRADEGDNSYAGQLAHLAAALRDGTPSILDAARGVDTMRTVDAVYRAAGLQPR